MKKSISLVLLAFLSAILLWATAQKSKEFGPACFSGNIDAVKRLIKADVDVNEKFKFGVIRNITALHIACMSRGVFSRSDHKEADQVEIVKALIGAGANVNATYKGMSVLHYAVESHGYEAILEPLVANGFNVNAKNIGGHTPLHGTAIYGRIEWAKALIKNGADVNAKSNTGETPLDSAIRFESKDQKEMIDLLRKHGGVSGKK